MDIFMFKSNRFLLSLLALGLLTNLSAQKWTPQHYTGISPENFKEVFHERFDDNERNWNADQFSFNAHFEEGGLEVKSLIEGATHYSKVYEFNKNKNYQISTTFSFQKSSGKAGIAFGMDANSNGYMFIVAPEGHFEFVKLINGAQEVLQESMYPVSSDGNNELTVRKVDESWYFFINKNGVLHFDAQYMPSTAVGWALMKRANILVDDLVIQNIEVSDIKGPIISILSSGDLEKRGKQQNNIFLCNKSSLSVTGYTGDQYGVKEINIESADRMQIDHSIIENNRDGIKFRFNLNLTKDTTVIFVSSIDNYDNASMSHFYFVQKKVEPKAAEVAATIPVIPEDESRFIPADPNQKSRNVALFIGVNQYEHWDDLNNAVYDCNTVADVLAEEYQFDRENIIKMYNADVTRQNIMDVLDSLQKVLGRNDNLILYYAGHGHYNEDSKFGYWVPSEARMEKPSDYISNNDIKAYLGAIQTRHTLVIADACFAGSLMRGEANVELREDATSRWVFTSGDLENVDDGPVGQNSPFAASLIRTLKNNPNSYLRADVLSKQVQKNMLSSNASQRPKAKPIKDIDQGGIFVFRRKE